jgi:membrane-bound lytic murein transglycosylase D
MKNISLVILLFVLSWGGRLTAQVKSSDELYQARLATLKSPIDFSYHPSVKKYIDAYLENPDRTREIIGLSKVYFPVIERALRARSVTTDMKYLAVAVSELAPSIQNSYGATGMWMMMYNISRMYKVKVNSFVDERRDPVRSSAAAATHFRDLFSIYKQWPLVIAAYGSSPVALNKCIRLAGNSLYFWDLYPLLPEASRDLYPRVVAAAYILNFYREHGIKPVFPELHVETDSVRVNKWLSFQQISATLDIPLDQLRALNPIFKKDVIPYNLDGYWIILPRNKGAQFTLLRDSVYNPLPRPSDFKPIDIRKAETDSASVTTETTSTAHSATDKPFDKKRVIYTVKSGDFLLDIADWFDVEVREIKSWNKLKSDRLRRSQKLSIWVKSSKSGYYRQINTMSAKQKLRLKRKD